MLKGILFDMDGTLIDSEPVHYRAYEMILNPLGYHLEWSVYETFLGTTRQVIQDSLRKQFPGLSMSMEAFEQMLSDNKASIYAAEGYPMLEGVPKMLEALKDAGYRLAVASSSAQWYIEDVIEKLGIAKYFDEVVSGELVEHPKPAPDVFLLTAKKLGLAPAECLVVEDSHNGVLAGNAAGMASVAFLNPNSAGQDVSMATTSVCDFAEFTPEKAKEAWEMFLVKMAAKAREAARVPQSGFRVGAALAAEDGRIFTGCNVELKQMLTSICAERCALVKGVSEGCCAFEAIAIASDLAEPISPCGTCRQYLVDFGEDMIVLLGNRDGSQIIRTTAGELLPLAFSGTQKGIE